jgi:hypothetical protein
MIVGRIQKTTGMATAEQLVGFQTIVQTIEEQIQIISQDDTQAERARKYSEALSKLMNLIKAFAQRLQQQMKAAAANGANGQDPEAAAKVQATMMQAKVKADNASTSHAQKTAQRQVQWEAEEKRKQQQHDFDLAAQAKTVEADIAATDAETAAEIRRQRVKAENEPKEKATAE